MPDVEASHPTKRKRIFPEHRSFSEVQAGIREGRYHQVGFLAGWWWVYEGCKVLARN